MAADPRPSRDHLGMMQQPKYWPNWPYLPLKRIRNGRIETGILYERGMREPHDLMWLEGGNLFHLKEASFETAVLADCRRLVSDGWIVD